jgi:hypothetical protein
MGAVIGGIIIGNILSGAMHGGLGSGVTACTRAKSLSTSLVSGSSTSFGGIVGRRVRRRRTLLTASLTTATICLIKFR